MGDHHIQGSVEAFGVAAYHMTLQLMRQLAADSAALKVLCAHALEEAAGNAERTGDDIGLEAAALIRRVQEMRPFAGRPESPPR